MILLELCASEPAVAPDPLPSTEPLPSTKPAEPVKPLEPTQPVEEEKEFNAISTRIPVSYRTNQAKPSPARKEILKPQPKPTVLAKELRAKNQLLQLKLELNFLEEVVKSQ